MTKDSITIRTNNSAGICTMCKSFDPSRLFQLPDCKGYCEKKNIALYRLDHDECIDFVGVIPKIEVVPSD